MYHQYLFIPQDTREDCWLCRTTTAVDFNPFFFFTVSTIDGLQPIPGDPKDNGMVAMLDDKTKGSVIRHGCHTVVFGPLQIGCKPPIKILYN